MKCKGLPQRAVWGIGLLLAAALWPALAGASEPASETVRGLIVRLKDAPAHTQLSVRPGGAERERALALVAREHEGQRWQRVLAESGLSGAVGRAAPALRPVGRDQRLLKFAAPMSAADVSRVISQLRARPDVDWVDTDTRERRLQVPNDPYFPYTSGGGQWWLAPVGGANGNVLADRRRGVPGFQAAWLLPGGTGAPTAVVAVLDTGITPHPDLAGRLLPGFDFVADIKFAADGNGRDADPSDPGDGVFPADLSDRHFDGCVATASSWHGTVIAGIVAARTNNAEGVAAIQWNGRVLPVRVAGKCGADVSDIVEGMRWAAGLPACRVDDGFGNCTEYAPTNPNPARIVNISFGSNKACGAAYQTAVNELKAAGVVVVAAAGNEHAAPTRPANCVGAVGVAGLARDGYKTHYSNFGAELSATGIATVAGDDNERDLPVDQRSRWWSLADEGLLAIGNGGELGSLANPFTPDYFYFWGTSFSAPIVSGALGLMLSVNPALTYTQLIDGLRRSARPHVVSPHIRSCSNDNPGRCLCSTTTCGAGILDAEQALLFAANPSSYVAPARLAATLDSTDLAQLAAQFPQDRPANAVTEAPPASGGGGSMSAAWLMALLWAAASLGLSRRRSRAHHRA